MSSIQENRRQTHRFESIGEKIYRRLMGRRKANRSSSRTSPAMVSESLFTKEKMLREEAERELAKTKLELQRASDEQLILEEEIANLNHALNEMITKQEETQLSFMRRTAERLEIQIEFNNALAPCFATFSPSELINATKNFDPELRIGDGFLGPVYKGYARSMPVAVKFIMDEFADQQITDHPSTWHPHLLSPVGICAELNALVYPYQTAGSLEDQLFSCEKGKPPFTWQTRMCVAAQICSALLSLHNAGNHHGDLKLANVLLDADFSAKLVSFGVNFCDDSTTLSQLADIFALGKIILQLLTGKSVVITQEVQSAVDNKVVKGILDPRAGEWPLQLVLQLANLGLDCCMADKEWRPDLEAHLQVMLKSMKDPTTAVSETALKLPQSIRELPFMFICPIRQEIMRDPQVAADGFTYEGEAITGWFSSGHRTSPMTNLNLSNLNLIPNHPLRSAIQEWLRASTVK